MKLLSINYPKTDADIEKIEYLTRNYHALQEKIVKADDRLIKLELIAKRDAVNHKATVGVQLSQLMNRAWVLAKRDPRLSRAKIFQTVAVVLFMMPVFWQLNDYNDKVIV